MGSDVLTATDSDGTGHRNGFKISNAVMADGTEITLQYVDFVKVQVAVQAESGHLGEISTEVTSVADYKLLN